MDTLTIQTPTCRCCAAMVSEADTYCGSCGFPLKASEGDQQQFIYDRDHKQNELYYMEKKVRNASKTLYWTALLFIVMGFLYLIVYPDTGLGTAVMIQQVILAAIYVGLGFWSKKKPVAAIITGLVIFALYQIILIMEDPTNIVRGIIVKVVIVVYLIKGLTGALSAEKMRKQYNLQ